MKIQVISYQKAIRYGNEHEYTYSSLSDPISFDAFDINIISLQTPSLWVYDQNSMSTINEIKDFRSLKPLINAVKTSKVIICFPQNYNYCYNKYGNDYCNSCLLKDMISYFKEHLSSLLSKNYPYELIYENSATICNGTKYNAAFYFTGEHIKRNGITKSFGGQNSTTITLSQSLIYTTLDISKSDVNINDFLGAIGCIEHNSDIPKWIKDVKFLDDETQERIVTDANDEIEKQKQIIRLANEKIEQNLRYKSILFETGEKLVEVVFEILEKLLNCSLKDFVDEKKEDFKIALPDVTFIGEIKGITSNVRSENVSQLDVHCQSYSDYLQENDKTENIKGILIINPLRNKPISERDEVHENQIRIANRNGSLIVTTETLLHLFVAYLENKITNDGIIDLLKNKTGLLTVSDFTK